MAKKSSSKSMRIYEALYLLDSAVTKERQSEIVGLIKKTCESQGGRVLREVAKGRRRLSYSIGSHTEGQYLTLYYEAPPVINELLRKALQYQEDIIRTQTLVIEALPGTLESTSSASSIETTKSGDAAKSASSEPASSVSSSPTSEPATSSSSSPTSEPATSSSSSPSSEPASSSSSSPSTEPAGKPETGQDNG